MNRIQTVLATFGIATLTFVAAGCSDYTVTTDKGYQGGVSDEGQPDIVVDPEEVDFGDVPVDTTSAPDTSSQVVVVSNEGDADLHIEDIYLADETAPFTVGAISSVLIQPGGTAQFTVTFTPVTAADSSTKVEIESDDPDEPLTEVKLTGTGVAPVIDVVPADYDFGTLYIGCTGEEPLTISNVGNADLVVSDFAYNTASDDLTFDPAEDVNGSLPWTLAPGESTEVYVDYAPLDEYPDSAYLTVESNDPYTPSLTVTQTGSGVLAGEYTDVFEQPIKGATDIIFALDRSCSMLDNLTNVSNNFGTFVNTLVTLDADYHVAAVVDDDGCINGRELYIDNSFSASEAEDTITTMMDLSYAYGYYGANTERAFSLMEACLSEIGSGGCNEGLVRDEAKLNLVGVSDEKEQSPNPWSYYVTLFQSLKSNPDDVVFHAIGGDYPSGCGGTASAYTGMYEATVATGGVFLSICATDWGSHLEALAEGSVAQLDTFELTETPVPETITVKIDGISSTVGWSYDASTNSVVFDSDYIPEGGSTIEVNYALYGNCDE